MAAILALHCKSMYVLEQIGPALARLRRAAGMRQVDVARRMDVSDSIPSRAERPGSNVELATLLRFLGAVGATFADLERALSPPDDPLAEEMREMDARIETDPSFRRGLADLMEKYETARLPDLVKLVAESEARWRELAGRVEQLEESLPLGEELEPDATEEG